MDRTLGRNAAVSPLVSLGLTDSPSKSLGVTLVHLAQLALTLALPGRTRLRNHLIRVVSLGLTGFHLVLFGFTWFSCF